MLDFWLFFENIWVKIWFVFYLDIFVEFVDVLLIFNLLVIESMFWRIDGFSECFMYFNDDVFLVVFLKLIDVFSGSFFIL